MDAEIWSGIYCFHVGKKSRCICGKVRHFPFQLVSQQKSILKTKKYLQNELEGLYFFSFMYKQEKASIIYSLKTPENFLFLVLSGGIKWEHLLEMDGKAFSSKYTVLDSSVARICLLHKRWVVLAKLFCDLI